MVEYLDGKYGDSSEAKVSIYDHGLLYGDGVFEGIRLYSGNVYRLDDHLERLEQSRKALMLDVPLPRAAMVEAGGETCRRDKLPSGYNRLPTTRGAGEPGPSPRRVE